MSSTSSSLLHAPVPAVIGSSAMERRHAASDQSEASPSPGRDFLGEPTALQAAEALRGSSASSARLAPTAPTPHSAKSPRAEDADMKVNTVQQQQPQQQGTADVPPCSAPVGGHAESSSSSSALRPVFANVTLNSNSGNNSDRVKTKVTSSSSTRPATPTAYADQPSNLPLAPVSAVEKTNKTITTTTASTLPATRLPGSAEFEAVVAEGRHRDLQLDIEGAAVYVRDRMPVPAWLAKRLPATAATSAAIRLAAAEQSDDPRPLAPPAATTKTSPTSACPQPRGRVLVIAPRPSPTDLPSTMLPTPNVAFKSNSNAKAPAASLRIIDLSGSGDPLASFIGTHRKVSMNTDGHVVVHASATATPSPALPPGASSAPGPASVASATPVQKKGGTMQQRAADPPPLSIEQRIGALQAKIDDEVLDALNLAGNARRHGAKGRIAAMEYDLASLKAQQLAVTAPPQSAATAAPPSRHPPAPSAPTKRHRRTASADHKEQVASAAPSAPAAATAPTPAPSMPRPADVACDNGSIASASALLPVTSPLAVTGAALAALIARQGLSTEEEFWVQYLSVQDLRINSSSALCFNEDVSIAGSSTMKSRSLLLQLGSSPKKYTTVHFNNAQHGNLFRRVYEAHCERSGIPISLLKRTVLLRQFKNCRALITMPLAEWTNDEHVYGVFPILPGFSSNGNRGPALPSLESDVARFRSFSATYDSMITILTPYDVEKFRADHAARSGAPAGPAPMHVPPADAMGRRNLANINGGNVWSTVTVAFDSHEYDKLVDEALDDMMSGKFVGMLKKPSSEPNKQAYALLQLQNLRGYADSTDRKEKNRMIRRFLACNLLHGRRLLGSKLSQRVRDTHERSQLNPDAASRTILTEISTQPPRSDVKKVSEAEFDERCVRRAFSLARQGELGRGNAALQRSQVPSAPFEQMRADLVALHPQGVEYPKTTFAGGTVSIDTSGSSLRLPTDVLPHVFTSADVPIDNLKRDAKNCADASPGPDGMTGHHVHACLMASDEFARNHQAMIVDMANCNIYDDDLIDIINASLLHGIPKATAAGTRPLALGGTNLKLTGHAVKRIAEPELKRMFHGKQFGSAPGGAEYMVHVIRRFIDTGERPDGTFAPASRGVIAVDAKNAFNNLLRTSMFDAAGRIGALHGFLNLTYRRAARLIFNGHSDQHLFSQQGVRQGEVGGCAIFCAVQQRCLDAAAQVSGVHPLSFIDDAYLLADSIEHAAASFNLYETALKANGGEVNAVKSDVLFADPNAQLDRAAFPMFASFKQCTVIKCLGASVGITRALEKEHLEKRYVEAFATTIRRLRLSPSPQLFTVIRTCFLPKLGHALRTHSPEVTRDLCQMFDALIADTLRHWASMPRLTPRQLAIIQLPLVHGGMGFLSTEATAPAAFKASNTASLCREFTTVKAKPTIKQSTLMQALNQALYDAHTRNDAELVSILEHGRLKGADHGLSFTGSAVHPDVYSALLRMTLGGVSVAASSLVGEVACPGCNKPLSAEDFWRHTIGCVRVKGGLVTLRHNAVVAFMRNIFAQAGDNPSRSEPRHLRHVQCGCGRSFPHDVYEQHKSGGGCTSAVVHTSGPDILSYDHCLPHGSAVVSDVTIVSARSDSHRGLSIEQMFDAKRLEKRNKYSAHLTDACISRFDILVATANGHLGAEFIAQIARCCAATLDDPRTIQAELSALITRFTAQCLLHAETLACIRPPSLHLETLRLVKSFNVGPVDPKHDADTPKSASLPRADDPTPPALHVTAEQLSALISLTLPPLIRNALRNFADEAAAAAFKEQREELERRNEADAVRRADRAAAAEEQHSDTVSAESEEAGFREVVAAELSTEQRRATDERYIRTLEAGMKADSAARAKRNAAHRRDITSSCESIVAAADAPSTVLANKVLRACDAVAGRRQALALLEHSAAQVERDAAELDRWCEAETDRVSLAVQRSQEATTTMETRFVDALDETEVLDQKVAVSQARLSAARASLSRSQQRASDIESAEFRESLSKCARHAAGEHSDALNCASPTSVHKLEESSWPANFLGQVPDHCQQQQQPFLCEESGAVPPAQGYGNPSSLSRSSSRHGSSSVSQSQHRAQPSQRRPEFSPELDREHKHFAGRTAAASQSVPASQSVRVAQGNATPAAALSLHPSSAPSAPAKHNASQSAARQNEFASTARALATPSAASQRSAGSAPGVGSPPPRVHFIDNGAPQLPGRQEISSLSKNSSTDSLSHQPRSQTRLSMSSCASRVASPPPQIAATSGLRLQQPLSFSSAPQQQRSSTSSGQPGFSSLSKNSSTDSLACQQQQQQQQPAFATHGAEADSPTVDSYTRRRSERVPSPDNAARRRLQ